jgi:hypothetical protein
MPVLCLLAMTAGYSCAMNVPGYIITTNSDTVHGMVKLTKFNQATGGLMMSGFDRDILHLSVSFRKEGEKDFETYTPDMIGGFAFTFESHDYYYKSFLLDYRSIFPNEKQVYRFLMLVHRGNIDLYQDVKYTGNAAGTSVQGTYATYSYYLYTPSKGLLRVEMTDQARTVQDLLFQYGVDIRFIKEIPANANFKDIRKILDDYDRWVSGNG